jgi:hypothetical protein
MNPNNQINPINPNNEPFELDLGPLPVLQRHNPPVYFGADAEELLENREFQGYNTPDDFVMPERCSRCYWAQCNGTCELDTPFIQAIRATHLSFEEEMDLPPPPALTKNTHVYLMDEEWAHPPPLTRGYTDSHLSDEILSRLAEAESNMRDEYEAAFFEQLQDKEHDEDEDEDKDR